MNTTLKKRKPTLKVILIIFIVILVVIIPSYYVLANLGFLWPYKINNIPLEDSITHFEEFSEKIDNYIQNSSHIVEDKIIENDVSEYSIKYEFSDGSELYVYLSNEYHGEESFSLWYHIGNNDAVGAETNLDLHFYYDILNILSGRVFSKEEIDELVTRRSDSSETDFIRNELTYGLALYRCSYVRSANPFETLYGNCDYLEKLSISGYTTYGIN